MVTPRLPRALGGLAGVVLSTALPAILGCAGPSLAAETPAVLERARSARGEAVPREFLASGSARYLGTEVPFRWTCGAAGRFRLEIEGPLGSMSGFDGSDTWIAEAGVGSRALALEERDVQRMTAWLWSGYWLDPSAPLAIELVERVEGRAILRVTMTDGHLESLVALDEVSGRALEARRDDESGPRTLLLEDWRDPVGIEGPGFPHRLVLRDASGQENVLTIDSFESPGGGEAARFARPSTRADARFAPDAGAVLETRLASSGHLLVRPRIEGHEVGWWILDTGASALVVDRRVAGELGLTSFGEVSALGAGGAVRSGFRTASSFGLGALQFDDPVFIELDLSGFDALLEVDDEGGVGGICGYDVFARCVMEIEFASGRVALHSPESYGDAGTAPPERAWTPLVLDERLPCVRGAFEGGHGGYFKLDTGADSTVVFHAPAVEELNLLDGRHTERVAPLGVGGLVEVWAGRLAWFELGGHRFERPRALFARTPFGALADRYTLGNVGAEFLAPFRLVLDYPRARMALVQL